MFNLQNTVIYFLGMLLDIIDCKHRNLPQVFLRITGTLVLLQMHHVRTDFLDIRRRKRLLICCKPCLLTLCNLIIKPLLWHQQTI